MLCPVYRLWNRRVSAGVQRAAVGVSLGITGLLLLGSQAAGQTQSGPLTLDEVLFRASQTVIAYAKDATSIAADEHMEQKLLNGTSEKKHRALDADFMMVHMPDGDGWFCFNDVYAVDGQPVRPRETRLEKAFAETAARSLQQARKTNSDSAHYSLGNFETNAAASTMPLIVVHPLQQYRFYFEKLGESKVGDTDAWEIRYTEHQRPTLMRGGMGDVFARGSVWLDPRDGRVLKSLISIGDQNSSAMTTVTTVYRHDAALDLWVPTELTESVQNPKDPHSDRVESVATLSNFRKIDRGGRRSH